MVLLVKIFLCYSKHDTVSGFKTPVRITLHKLLLPYPYSIAYLYVYLTLTRNREPNDVFDIFVWPYYNELKPMGRLHPLAFSLPRGFYRLPH